MQSKPTRVLLDEKAHKAVLAGINAIYEPVRRSLGPSGANALMYRTYNRGPRITNDGVTIAEVVEPKDEHENMAANAFKEACRRTGERAGDGTTTTAVIGGALVNDIFKSLDGGPKVIEGTSVSVMDIKNTLLKEAEIVKSNITKLATPIKTVKDLEKVAIVSVENEELGKKIAEVTHEIGADGFCDVTEGFTGAIETEIIHGMRFPAKVPARAFVNNAARHEMVVEDALVLLTSNPVDNVVEIGELINQLITTTKKRKFAILAPKFSDPVLVEFVAAMKNSCFLYPVAVPSLRTEQFEDLAAYFGATFISKEEGKKIGSVQPHHLGSVEKLVVKAVETREDATAIGGKGEKTKAIADRIEILKKQIEVTKIEVHKMQLRKRIASMASAIGIFRIGAATDAELLYTKMKVEDAVYACKGALAEGTVKGAGQIFIDASKELPENSYLKRALAQPNIQILKSTGEKSTKDIIDSAKSCRLAVEHAVGVAAHLITVDMIIAEERDRGPAEGYSDIAKAIGEYTGLWAKREGLRKDGEDEAWREEMNRADSIMRSDNG